MMSPTEPASTAPLPSEGGSYMRNEDGTLDRVAFTSDETPEADDEIGVVAGETVPQEG